MLGQVEQELRPLRRIAWNATRTDAQFVNGMTFTLR